jgi:FAD/FMN-containing dehydrogenase
MLAVRPPDQAGVKDMALEPTSRSCKPAEPVPSVGPDRRAVLVGGVAIGAAALSGGGSAAHHAGVRARGTGSIWTARPGSGPAAADWAALRRSLSTHELSRPGQSSYAHARQLFDPRFDSLRPTGVAFCNGHGDVSACLSFVRRFGLPVRARSGGHSYAGWSSVTGGLVIDVSQTNHFSAGTGNVTVGAGMDLINLYSALAARGRAMPGGSCPTVGLAGLALGGGVGVLSRQYGLTSDNLESVGIVTADGSFLTCDATHNSDLFWACRGGGGGNFGIVTTFTIRTRELSDLVLFFLSWPWSAAARVVRAWQSWAPHAPDALWSNMHLSAAFGGSPQISVGGTFIGSTSGAQSQLNQLFARVGSRPTSNFVRSETILNAMLVEAGCSELSVQECNTGPAGRLPRVPSFAKSDFFTRELSASGITALLAGIERLGSLRGAGGGGGAIAFDAFGGVINTVPADATAFVHRDALFLAQYSTSWNSPGSRSGIAAQHQWLRSYYADLHPHASGQAYQNYVDPDLSNWRQAYYGANYPMLASVKGKYDPTRLFRFPQGITA